MLIFTASRAGHAGIDYVSPYSIAIYWKGHVPCLVNDQMVYLWLVMIMPVVTIASLHDTAENLYENWSASACISEVERLRQEYIQWKYPDAEPRLQRTIAVIRRKAR